MRSKLLPIGPVIRWTPTQKTSAGAANGSLDSERLDWASGRNFISEERRCGLLTTVAESDHHSVAAPKRGAHTPQSPSTNRALMTARRLKCVIKAQCSDWQINEVDGAALESAELVHLTERPKGQWRKVTKGRTILIEDETQSEFFTPGKSFSARSLDLGVYRRIEGAVSPKYPLLRFLMYKEAYSTDAVLDRMFYEARIPKNAVLFAEERDGFGCVTQLGTGIGVSKERLPHASKHYSFYPLIFNPLTSVEVKPETVVAPIRGAKFRMLLRCVNADQAEIDKQVVERLTERGFINYFPVSVFSGCENSTFEIARAAGKGDFYSACSMWLQSEAERNPIVHQHFIRYLAADESTANTLLTTWITDISRYRSWRALQRFLECLRDGGAAMLSDSAAMRALHKQIPSWHRYEAGPAMFIWNAMASQRMLSYGNRVAIGDIVRVRVPSKSRAVGSLADCAMGVEWEHRLVETESDARKHTIFDVVLPMPHPAAMFPKHGVGRELYNTFAAAHQFSALLDDKTNDAWRKHSIQYRPVVARPEALQAICVHDPNSYTVLKTDLHLKQEMKSPTLPIGDRVRLPCKLNTSPRHVDKMQPILKKHEGSHSSVAVECFLPRGSHPLSMLREVFDVDHGTYHDVLTPTTISVV